MTLFDLMSDIIFFVSETPVLTDAGAVREIEAGLLHLMEEFEAGNLTAFGEWLPLPL